MSAAEVIEQFKALPSEEQKEVVEFIREFDGRDAASRQTREERFRAATDRVFEKHHELLRRLAE